MRGCATRKNEIKLISKNREMNDRHKKIIVAGFKVPCAQDVHLFAIVMNGNEKNRKSNCRGHLNLFYRPEIALPNAPISCAKKKTNKGSLGTTRKKRNRADGETRNFLREAKGERADAVTV